MDNFLRGASRYALGAAWRPLRGVAFSAAQPSEGRSGSACAHEAAALPALPAYRRFKMTKLHEPVPAWATVVARWGIEYGFQPWQIPLLVETLAIRKYFETHPGGQTHIRAARSAARRLGERFAPALLPAIAGVPPAGGVLGMPPVPDFRYPVKTESESTCRIRLTALSSSRVWGKSRSCPWPGSRA